MNDKNHRKSTPPTPHEKRETVVKVPDGNAPADRERQDESAAEPVRAPPARHNGSVPVSER